MIIFDGFIVTLAFFFSYLVREHFHQIYKFDLFPAVQVIKNPSGSISEYLFVLFIIVPLWCFMLYFNGMYRSMRTKTFLEILWIIMKSAVFTFLAFGTVVFLLRLELISRLLFIIFVMVSLAFILGEKIVIFSYLHHIRKRGLNFRRLLVVGTGRRASSFIHKTQSHPEWGFDILGVIDDEPGRGVKKVDGLDVIGDLEDIPEILHKYGVDEVVFVVPRSRLTHLEKSIYDCEIEGVKATVAVDLFDLKIAKARPTELDGIPLVTYETTVAKEWELFIKRTIDVILSGFGIFILGPFLLIISILIKLTSPGPILFKQERVGLNGRRFMIYKFRTMSKEGQEKLSDVDIYTEIYEEKYKNKKLQYVMPVGKILRKVSFDELPQLFNVFLGHMSLVGPRPTVPEEVIQYKAWHRRRFSMRPGMTCLWQIQGRREIQFNEWMKLDLEYLDNWSIWLDLKILAKTIPAVLFGTGAY